ncbi:unnamed protein product [Cylindrotheca closterium]|uniref:Uncharacterized protein n=1 Tax=Cylindrotheca closterium TaxID=2856 RepID=A0AAD2GBT6_9STRA|nr:unnamed protein product [Cylindrotheca closterium]
MKLKVSMNPCSGQRIFRLLVLVVIVAVGLTLQGTSIARVQSDLKLSLLDTVAMVKENIPSVLAEGSEEGRSLRAVTSSPTTSRAPSPQRNWTKPPKDHSEYTRNVERLHRAVNASLEVSSTPPTPSPEEEKKAKEAHIALREQQLVEARERAYQKYGAPIETPYFNASVPFEHFSHIKYYGFAGLGHRLARQAVAMYLARRMGFACRGYWSRTIYSNKTTDLFTEMFEPYTRDDFKYVNSTGKHVGYSNEVDGAMGMVSSNSEGQEGPPCTCTNDEVQVHYDFYMSLRNKYRRRDRIQAFMEENKFAEHIVFGIHIRAGNGETGDFTNKDRPINFDPKVFVLTVLKKIVETWPPDSLSKPPMIFLATDDPKYRMLILDQLEELGLSWPVALLEQEFMESGVLLGANRDSDVDQWHFMFQDMVILSYADVVLAIKYSSFTQSLPASIVMGRPLAERTIKDSFCEFIDVTKEEGSPVTVFANETAPIFEVHCYDQVMRWCCWNPNKTHKKALKFTTLEYQTQFPNMTVYNFAKNEYLSFETALGQTLGKRKLSYVKVL